MLFAGGGREAVTVGGSDALGGALAAKASPGVGVEVSWPPNVLAVVDCEFWASICR